MVDESLDVAISKLTSYDNAPMYLNNKHIARVQDLVLMIAYQVRRVTVKRGNLGRGGNLGPSLVLFY